MNPLRRQLKSLGSLLTLFGSKPKVQTLLVLIFLTTSSAFSIGWFMGSDSLYFKINKSLETFGEVFRRASTEYVDDVDPELFVRSGIDAMMATLDPYSVYMDQEQSEDFDSQVTGQYVGLGIQAGTRDSMLTITAVAEGYAAHQAGLRVGDRLLSLDGHRTLGLSSRELRKYTRGEDSSKVDVKVLRDGLSDTLSFQLVRRRVTVYSVPYIQRLANGVGLIKLDRFSRRSAMEVRNAIDSLRSLGPISGFILDLRDNPGGLLDASINISELFVKNGATIVSTKGRNNAEARVYTSSSVPYDAESPLVVLVNGASASASEVLAGCIQDQDRGVICGVQSFGKGLVQSQFNVSYGTNLKLTTQRYYCPSGRCVQRIDYSKKRIGVVDTATAPRSFFTANKRVVKDGSGIAPDSVIKDRELVEFVRELVERDILFRFANEYSSTKSELPSGFNASTLLPELERFAARQKFSYQSTALKKVAEAKKLLQEQKFSSSIAQQLADTESLIQKEQQKMFRIHSAQIAKLLDKEVRQRFMSDRQLLNYMMRDDELVQKASDLALSDAYRALLRQPLATRE